MTNPGPRHAATVCGLQWAATSQRGNNDMSKMSELALMEYEQRKEEQKMQNYKQQDEDTVPALSEEEMVRALLAEASKSSAPPLLKFKDGGYHIRKVPVPLGTKYYAHPANWENQWVLFEENKVAQRIRAKVAAKQSLPERRTLSHPDLEDTENDP
jgi:hypothetical protein